MTPQQSNAIMTYQANDGTKVKISPAIVAKYMLQGTAQATDAEIFGFMHKCRARGLNPLAGDAYFVKYGGKNPTASVIVSKDYFVRIATQQETFDGMEKGLVLRNKKTGEFIRREGAIYSKVTEEIVGAWCKVYDKRRRLPSTAEVAFEEYNQNRSLWLSKPATMIIKVAEVQALREAYSEKFAGLYDSAEMGKGGADEDSLHEQIAAQIEVENVLETEPQAQPQAQPQPAEPKQEQAAAQPKQEPAEAVYEPVSEPEYSFDYDTGEMRF